MTRTNTTVYIYNGKQNVLDLYEVQSLKMMVHTYTLSEIIYHTTVKVIDYIQLLCQTEYYTYICMFIYNRHLLLLLKIIQV